MSQARRRALAALARKLDLPVIEDDAYGAFAPHLPALAQLAPDHVFHIATLSKCLSPGLRTAFVVAPLAASGRVAEALRAVCLMPAPFLSDMATRWIETGIAAGLFDAIKSESAARMKLARSILPPRAQGGPEGFHLWMTAPKGWALAPYVAAARAQGVVMVGAGLFAVEAEPPSAVRLSLGAAPDRERLAAGLSALAALERDEPARAIV